MRPWLPSYGAPEIRAPHLTSFAESGIQFENCYVQQAVCSPTRNSFMSGRRPDRTRLWNFKGSFRTTGIDARGSPGSKWRTLPGAFTTSGWNTAGCGKTFHPGSPPNWDIAGGSWTFNRSSDGKNNLLLPYVSPNSQVYSFDTHLTAAQRQAPLDTAFGPCVPRAQANRTTDLRITTCDLADDLTTDVAIANAAINNIQKLAKLRQTPRNTSGSGDFGGRPFFLAAGFHKPHPYWPLPSALQKSYWHNLSLPKHRLAPVGMPAPAFVSCDFLQDTADAAQDVARGHGILPNESFTDDLTRKIRAGYAAGITHTDTQVGRVLDALESSHEANNTVVLFSADHGWGLGENGIWCKYTVFENQVRVPLIMRVPWLQPERRGTKSSALVEMVDIMPTLLDFAGILDAVSATEALDGSSFKPLLEGFSDQHFRKDRFALAPPSPSLWNKSFAFSQYPRCMNSTLAREPPYTPNRDVCVGHPADEFTHMGLSVRTHDWRYSEWFRWDGNKCAPMLHVASAGAELYDHRGLDVPGSFDYEHTNVVDVPANAGTVRTLRSVLISHFEADGGDISTRSCPPPTSDEEQNQIDMTLERLF